MQYDLIHITNGKITQQKNQSINDPFAYRQSMHERNQDIFFLNPLRGSVKLFMADMDSTIVHGETLDDIAAHIGIAGRVSAITAKAMNGELDFESALEERVALLKDQPISILDTVEIKLNKGAQYFVSTLNIPSALVSGGFTQLTQRISHQCGFTYQFGNTLEQKNGLLTGKIKKPILNKNAKVKIMHDLCNKQNIKTDTVLAIGDGANDIDMLSTAGIGIGYRPKPIVKQTILNVLCFNDFDCLKTLLN